MYTLVHVFILKKLSFRAAVVANRSVTAAVSVRWICVSIIIRHSRRFSSMQFNAQCECCKQNKLLLPYIFFLEGIGGGFGHPDHPLTIRHCFHLPCALYCSLSHLHLRLSVFVYFYRASIAFVYLILHMALSLIAQTHVILKGM